MESNLPPNEYSLRVSLASIILISKKPFSFRKSKDFLDGVDCDIWWMVSHVSLNTHYSHIQKLFTFKGKQWKYVMKVRWQT